MNSRKKTTPPSGRSPWLRRHSPDADAGILNQNNGTFSHRIPGLSNGNLQPLPYLHLAGRMESQQYNACT
jgi:hypothetical protein